MHLTQAELFGPIDNADRGIRYVYTYFYYCRAHKHADGRLRLGKRVHDLRFFPGTHLAMEHGYTAREEGIELVISLLDTAARHVGGR